MHHSRSLRRLILGAAVAGAAIGAVPAMASAASTCLYNPTTKQVSIEENSSNAFLMITRSGDNIVIIDSFDPRAASKICTNQVDFFTVEATVHNTDRINVNSVNKGFSKVILLEQLGPGATHESDGVDEIETLVTTTNPRLSLDLEGSSGPDGIRVGAAGINFGFDFNATDNDVDIQTTTRPEHITIHGQGGDDALSGRGNFFNPQPTDVPLTLSGGLGNDFVEGGLARDSLAGGGGDDINGKDRLFSNDGQLDELFGGPGFDTATTDVNEKSIQGIQVRTVEPVGHLRLAPRALRSRAGHTARLTMSWKHPNAWRDLRSVELRLHRGKQAVGLINARPGSGRLTGRGAVDLMPGSRLSHHGRWITAKLALRLSKSLAGADLRVDVRATDRDGHRQLERDAGVIHVAK